MMFHRCELINLQHEQENSEHLCTASLLNLKQAQQQAPIMDSYDDEISLNNTYRMTGKGRINSPLNLRASRSMEHRAPTDAQLRLFPAYEPDNESKDDGDTDSYDAADGAEFDNRDEEASLSSDDEDHYKNSSSNSCQSYSRHLQYLQEDATALIKYVNHTGNKLLKVAERRKVAEDAHKVMLAL